MNNMTIDLDDEDDDHQQLFNQGLENICSNLFYQI